MALAMVAVLLGLGTWQVERLQWKDALLRDIARAESAAPVVLPAAPAGLMPFTKVRAQGSFRPGAFALYADDVRNTAAGPVMGAFLLQPLDRPGAEPVIVNRGWVPLDQAGSAVAPGVMLPSGPAVVDGYLRAPDRPGLLSAADDAARRRFFTLDPAAVGRALGVAQVAPFTLVAMGAPAVPGGPIPAEHLPQPPNNHLSSAITWYGLAASLVAMFVAWARGAVRG